MAQIEMMNGAEAFATFIRGLKPEIRQQVGVHVEKGNLQAAKEMALRMDAYAPQGSTSKKADNRKNRQVHNIEGGGRKDKNKQKTLTKEEVNALLAAEKKKWEKAKNKEINEQNCCRNEKAKVTKEKIRKRGQGPCYLCQRQHHIRDCPNMARLRQGTGGGGLASTSQGN